MAETKQPTAEQVAQGKARAGGQTSTSGQLVDKVSSKGHFFKVGFYKKDGSFREMVCKKWVETAFTYGSANAKDNTCKHKENIYTVVDMGLENINSGKGAFRNINLDTLVSVTAGGVTTTFDNEV